jgi:hypothetical protein
VIIERFLPLASSDAFTRSFALGRIGILRANIFNYGDDSSLFEFLRLFNFHSVNEAKSRFIGMGGANISHI